MMSESVKTLISTAVIIAGLAAAAVLSGFLERAKPGLPEGFEDQDLSLQGKKLKGYGLGFEGLIADWYWMQSLQYLGNKLLNHPGQDIDLNDLRPLNPRLLYPYLDTATDLDPQFIAAYSYGAVVLPAIDPEKAVAITKKGIDNNPGEWRLYHYLGFIYWRLGQYDKSGEAYEKGSHVQGAPAFMALMAARMKTDGGSRDLARDMYREMFDGADDEQVRESAALQMLRLDSLDDIDAINAILADFQAQNGRCASSWGEIQARLRGIRSLSGRIVNGSPVDPAMVPYLLVKQNDACKAAIDANNSKIPAQ